MGFSGQEYWSASPFPSPGNLPNPGVELGSPASQADSLPMSHLGSPKQLYSNLRKEKEKRKLVGAPKNYFTACYITQGLKDTSELFVFPQVSQVNT